MLGLHLLVPNERATETQQHVLICRIIKPESLYERRNPLTLNTNSETLIHIMITITLVLRRGKKN